MRGKITLVFVIVALLTLPALSLAQSLLIDDFSANQAALTLTFPPAGTSASSSVSDVGIFGGERDLQVNLTAGVIAGNTLSGTVSSGFFSYSQDATIAGTGVLSWDGADGSATLNETGLGGIDLKVGGTQDAFLLRFAFDDLPADVTIEVFTDAGNASSFTFALPGLIFSSTDFVLPYSAFTPSLGSGADFNSVGAIRLTLGSTTTAPDIVLDSFQTTTSARATLTVALQSDVNGNTLADPGDTLRYTAVVSNPTDGFGASVTGAAYASAIPGFTSLVVGSVTTSAGSVTTGNTGGDTSVGVSIGALADGANATITYDVLIDDPLPPGVTQIASQGTASTDTLLLLLTDDPGTATLDDQTMIAVAAMPVLDATLVATLVNDVNGNTLVDPGDSVQYTAVVTNSGSQSAANVSFTVPLDSNTQPVLNAVTTTQGSVLVGNNPSDTSVSVFLGAIAGGGGNATITYQVTVIDPLPPGVTQISAQGTVTALDLAPTLTDNPATGAAGDPTVTPVVGPAAPPAEVPTLNEWGLFAFVLALLALGVRRLRSAVA